jgi:hypothetical protein
MRLRQIAFVAHDLEPVAAALDAVLGLKVAFRDPGVGVFGLVNVVMPVGGEFLEIVQPVRPDASAARYLTRRGGDAGYMAIFQDADALAHRRRLADAGVRLIAEHAGKGYVFTHFHPGDFGGVLTSIDETPGVADWRAPMSDWPPAGKDWRNFPAGRARGITAVTIQSPDPAAAARFWGERLAQPVKNGAVVLARGTLRFVAPIDKDGAGIVGLDIETAEPDAAFAAAERRGLARRDDAVSIGGVWLRLTPVLN